MIVSTLAAIVQCAIHKMTSYYPRSTRPKYPRQLLLISLPRCPKTIHSVHLIIFFFFCLALHSIQFASVTMTGKILLLLVGFGSYTHVGGEQG